MDTPPPPISHVHPAERAALRHLQEPQHEPKFFWLRKARGPNSVFLSIDFAFEDIENPMIMPRRDPVPASFMSFFDFALSPGLLEDSIANHVWHVLSPRVIGILKTARNAEDLNIVPLPPAAVRLHFGLAGYAAVGVRRQVACLDPGASDVRWTENVPGKRVDAVYQPVILADCVPEDCDIFLLEEWPVTPILRANLAGALNLLRPTGMILQPLKSSISRRGQV